ncbi:MAG: L-aspartate oxidase [Desulfovibrionaceae bacterium]
MHTYRLKTDALVIGSGIAGCTAALTLADAGISVTLLTSAEQLVSGNTPLAQGGIATLAPGEDPRQFERDILTAGWKQNYVKAVHYLCRRGPQVLEDLLVNRLHVPFARTTGDDGSGDGPFLHTREGGHSNPRILFCADHTGRNIIEGLAAAVEAHEGITVLTQRTAIDLLTTHHHARHLDFMYSLTNQCVGAYVFNQQLGRVETLLSDWTVLATGGVGQIYLHTTNPPGSIGSGLSMANRAGARILGAEYVQFHPTALYQGSRKSGQRFLVSEAVRGEGAVLVNGKGEPFMQRYDQRADLAPRDVVTRAIMDELLHTGEDCVYLDASHMHADPKERFPTIYERCQKDLGVDMRCDHIPVVPVAHFFCGGVQVDTAARTTLERLYAAGECSCTGVHGANRLASTSLLEALLWGHAAAEDIKRRRSHKSHLSRKLMDSIPDWEALSTTPNEDPALIAQDWSTIRNTMWNYVGISRSTSRLARAFSDLRSLYKNLVDFYKATPVSKPIIDLMHGCQAAYTITLAAMRDRESKGCHTRVD